MIHRALYGSLERFLGVVLEQHGAALPAWLAPEQIAVLPVGEAQVARAHELAAQLPLRVRVDVGDTLARRVAVANHDGVPYCVVIGDRELADGTLAVRGRDGRFALPAPVAIAELVRRCSVTGHEPGGTA
jgi:threonyl-tRNA synthetase